MKSKIVAVPRETFC